MGELARPGKERLAREAPGGGTGEAGDKYLDLGQAGRKGNINGAYTGGHGKGTVVVLLVAQTRFLEKRMEQALNTKRRYNLGLPSRGPISDEGAPQKRRCEDCARLLRQGRGRAGGERAKDCVQRVRGSEERSVHESSSSAQPACSQHLKLVDRVLSSVRPSSDSPKRTLKPSDLPLVVFSASQAPKLTPRPGRAHLHRSPALFHAPYPTGRTTVVLRCLLCASNCLCSARCCRHCRLPPLAALARPSRCPVAPQKGGAPYSSTTSRSLPLLPEPQAYHRRLAPAASLPSSHPSPAS